MNCAEMENLLGPYHDGELDPARSVEVESHLRGCPDCTRAIERLRSLSEAVRSVPYFTAPPGLRDRVSQTRGRRPRPWMAIALAAAACLIAFVSLRPQGDELVGMEGEVVSSHVRSLLADHLVDVPSSDRHTVKPWFAGKLDFAPDVAPPEGFELVGGRLDYIGGRTVAALIYRRRQHVINVFTWPADGNTAPRSETIQGYHVVHWTRGGMTSWAVSDLAEDELKLLVR